jgi:hypothetical protein
LGGRREDSADENKAALSAAECGPMRQLGSHLWRVRPTCCLIAIVLQRILVSASLFIAACVTTNSSVQPTNPSPRPLSPRPVMSVEVFTVSRPSRPFVEVAIIKASGSSQGDASKGLVHEMRSEAARVGCDGIVVNGGAETVAPHDGMGGTVLGYSSACIVYTDAPARPATPAPAAAAAGPTAAPAGDADDTVAVLLRMFDRLDSDRDGVLAVAELPPDTAPRILTFDGNADGWVTRAEVVAGATRPPAGQAHAP